MSFFKLSETKPSVDIIQEKIPQILISKEAMIKMKLFIEGCSEEIGWLGTAYQEDNNIIITDMILFEQEVHSTTTEITPEGLSNFGEEILSQEGGIDLWNSIKIWGHSHVNMGTFASSQDDKQMITFKDCGHDWFIRIIGNKSGSIKLDLYNYKQGIIYKDLPWRIILTKEEEELIKLIEQIELKLEEDSIKLEEDLKKNVEEEIKNKVSKKSEITYIGKSYSSYDYDGWVNKTKYNNNYEDYYEKTEGSKKKSTIVDVRTKEEIKEDNEASGMFEQYVYEEIAEAGTIKEVREILDTWGFDDVYEIYTDKEIKDYWEECIKLAIADAYENLEDNKEVN